MSADGKPQTHYDYIDGLRAIAVLMVVIFHVFVSQPSRDNQLIANLGGIGARGVDLFFVLSGFCLALPFLQRMRVTGVLEVDYGRFMIRRFARIAPPYYVALVCFSLLALTPFGYPSTFARSVAALDGAGPREFFEDLMFMTTSQPVANASFWTLGIEMRWYFVCPFLIALFVRSRQIFYAVIIVAYAIFYFPQQHVLDAGTLPAFMLGIVAASIASRESQIKPWVCVVSTALVGTAVIHEATTGYGDHAFPLWHVALFSLVIASGSKVPAKLLSAKPLVFLGRASFSIYLVHQPLIVWLGHHGCAWPIAGVLATMVGIAFWWSVERILLEPQVRSYIESVIAKLCRRYRQPPIIVISSLAGQ